MSYSILRDIRLKFIFAVVAATVFASGSAGAQLGEGKQERLDIFFQQTVVGGLPAFFGGLNAQSLILQKSGISGGFNFNVTVFGATSVDQYSTNFPPLAPSEFKVSNQLKNARLQKQDVPVDIVTCDLDFTNCVHTATTADVDIVAVGEGAIFEEQFGPDLTCTIREGASANGSIVLESGLNIFGENALSGGISNCRGVIE